MKKLLLSVALSFLFLFSFNPGDEALAQQRNPVLEEFTGTWCPWCPCGHTIMEDIAAAIPNAILIGYHGPANGADPFSFFSGNTVINMLNPPFWPSGTPDRTGAPGSRDSWMSQMTARNSVPATVFIDVDRSFNSNTREFNATIDFTALANLNGEYNFTVILLESGIVWSQAGNSSCTGGSNYVHKHVVRDMMNGATGEEVINGVWKKPIHPTSSEYIFTENNTPTEFNAVLYNNSITKSLNHTIPSPGGTGPDMVWDNCDIVVMVHELGSQLYNGEIQQAVEMPLISLESPVNNEFLDDTYYISCSLEGPAGWTGEYTIANVTYPFGQVDSVQIASGDSAEISISVNPNGIGGYGETTLEFSSANNPGLSTSTVFRTITTTDVDILVVDASEENFGEYIFNSLENVYSGTFGIVTRSALHASGVDISNFNILTWSCGNALPVFTQDEVDMLQNYLDGGGRLFISGQDIGADIFEATGQSQFAESFYNNYLHARYWSNMGTSFLINGYDSDPISDGLQFVLDGSPYVRSPDQISPFNSEASRIFKFANGPEIAAIKAATSEYKVVYLGFGFEQIDDVATLDTLIARAVSWLMDGISSAGNNSPLVHSFSLEQNYPNPFNPSTTISYSLANEEHVSLKVYDIMGKEVAELVNEDQAAGTYTHKFDASSLASGMYFYKISAGNFVSTKKMVLLK